jgi:TRAP-type C4-dicarboxylate transport system substrate-binding protein
MSKLTKWQIQSKNLAELRERVSRKGVVIVPKASKEELQELTKQAQKNADKTLSNRFPKHVKL